MDAYIQSCFSTSIRKALQRVSAPELQQLEEIRVRVGRPVELCTAQHHSRFLMHNGQLTNEAGKGLVATAEDGQQMMNLVSRHSVYALEEELKRGYITIRGGHRVGLAGRAVVSAGEVKFLKDICSFNVRIARQIIGVAKPICRALQRKGRFVNTLIISPPQCGKTTLLRDLIRLLSEGDLSIPLLSHKVGLVDERSEVAGCLDGIPQQNVGPRTDVLDACPKAEGMMMLIRSMSPDVVVCDEIGRKEDTQAIMESLHAGVSVLTTAHGHHLQDVQSRPHLHELFTHSIFERYIILSRRNGAGTIERILDKEHKHIHYPNSHSPNKGGGVRYCLS